MSRRPALDDDTARISVLRAADSVFYAHGVAGASVADVRDAAGVSLKRLYGLYPAKRDLVAAWLETRHETWMTWFATAIDRIAATGTNPLLATFDAVGEWAASPGYRGCAFVNTAAEASATDDGHRAIIAAHKQALIDHLAERARSVGYRNPRRLGATIAVLLDGAIVEAAVLGSPAPIAAARAASARILEAYR